MLKTTLLACALALVAGTAHAAVGDMWFGVQGGMAIPTGDFGDVAKTGFQGTLSGQYGVAKNCYFGVDLGYHMWSAKDEINDALVAAPPLGFGPGSELKLSALQATAFGTYNFPMADEKQMPYIKIGAGIYNVKSKIEGGTLEEDESESNFGFNLGAGYDYEVSPAYTIGLLAAYHSIQTEGEATNLFTIGAKLAFGMKK
jgi:opacity protein-like surface antigen